MVYCTKCGTENKEDASVCEKCGASLNPTPYIRNQRYRFEDDACFGGQNHIWGIIIGLFIIMIGASTLIGFDVWDKLWPLFITLVGVIIVVNALMRRR
jgi:hypothetical protein